MLHTTATPASKPFMEYLLAALPILILLFLMVVLHLGGHIAGPVSLAVGILISLLAFGLNSEVLLIGLSKSLILSFYVLLIVWPAMLLYQTMQLSGGIQTLAFSLQRIIPDTGFLWLILAWCFSAFLEGIAGFGIPIAIVAPILVTLGMSPVIAVTSAAIGHAWAVTFGDMGVVFQALVGVVNMDPATLVIPAAILMGVACILCGIAVALVMRQARLIPYVLVIGLVMVSVQTSLAYIGLITLSGFLAGLSGILAGVLIKKKNGAKLLEPKTRAQLFAILGVYLVLSIILIFVFWPGQVREALQGIAWIPQFPGVATNTGFETPAGNGQIIRPFAHPGFWVLLTTIFTLPIYSSRQLIPAKGWKTALKTTWRSAAPASIAIIATVALSSLMEHTGMTQTLAKGLSISFKNSYPLVSPWVGILGAFATGSNTNSNILFGAMQKDIALLLQFSPAWLIAAQTAGGSLGSMLSPAKVILGCSTVNLKGQEGAVLKLTLPIGLMIGLLLGVIVLFFGA